MFRIDSLHYQIFQEIHVSEGFVVTKASIFDYDGLPKARENFPSGNKADLQYPFRL
jgi:hypothetical protein